MTESDQIDLGPESSILAGDKNSVHERAKSLALQASYTGILDWDLTLELRLRVETALRFLAEQDERYRPELAHHLLDVGWTLVQFQPAIVGGLERGSRLIRVDAALLAFEDAADIFLNIPNSQTEYQAGLVLALERCALELINLGAHSGSLGGRKENWKTALERLRGAERIALLAAGHDKRAQADLGPLLNLLADHLQAMGEIQQAARVFLTLSEVRRKYGVYGAETPSYLIGTHPGRASLSLSLDLDWPRLPAPYGLREQVSDAARLVDFGDRLLSEGNSDDAVDAFRAAEATYQAIPTRTQESELVLASVLRRIGTVLRGKVGHEVEAHAALCKSLELLERNSAKNASVQPAIWSVNSLIRSIELANGSS